MDQGFTLQDGFRPVKKQIGGEGMSVQDGACLGWSVEGQRRRIKIKAKFREDRWGERCPSRTD
jgi:hypothetical protein